VCFLAPRVSGGATLCCALIVCFPCVSRYPLAHAIHAWLLSVALCALNGRFLGYGFNQKDISGRTRSGAR
jgi:hypothetical protein